MDAKEREALKNRPKKMDAVVLPRNEGWAYAQPTNTWLHSDFPGVPFAKLHGSWVMIPLKSLQHPTDKDRVVAAGELRTDRYEPCEIDGLKARGKIHLFYHGIRQLDRALTIHIPQKYARESSKLKTIMSRGQEVVTAVLSWELPQWRDARLRNDYAKKSQEITESIGKPEQGSYLHRAKELFKKIADQCLLDSRGRVNPQAMESVSLNGLKRTVQRDLEILSILPNMADDEKAVALELKRIQAMVKGVRHWVGKTLEFISELNGVKLSDDRQPALRQLVEQLRILLQGTSAGEGLRSILVLPYRITLAQTCGDHLEQAIGQLKAHQWNEARANLQAIQNHFRAIEAFRDIENGLKKLVVPQAGYFTKDAPEQLTDAEKTKIVGELETYKTLLKERANLEPYNRYRVTISLRLTAAIKATESGDRERTRLAIAATEKADGRKGVLEATKETRDMCG